LNIYEHEDSMLLVEGFVKEEGMKTEADELFSTRFCSSKMDFKIKVNPEKFILNMGLNIYQ
jgi:hypothetical protein